MQVGFDKVHVYSIFERHFFSRNSIFSILNRFSGPPPVEKPIAPVVVADEGVAYIKVDRDRLDDRALDEIMARPA